MDQTTNEQLTNLINVFFHHSHKEVNKRFEDAKQINRDAVE